MRHPGAHAQSARLLRHDLCHVRACARQNPQSGQEYSGRGIVQTRRDSTQALRLAPIRHRHGEAELAELTCRSERTRKQNKNKNKKQNTASIGRPLQPRSPIPSSPVPRGCTRPQPALERRAPPPHAAPPTPPSPPCAAPAPQAARAETQPPALLPPRAPSSSLSAAPAPRSLRARPAATARARARVFGPNPPIHARV